jgi:hypothetical protein
MPVAEVRNNSPIRGNDAKGTECARPVSRLGAVYFVVGSARGLHVLIPAGRPQWVEWATAHHESPRLFHFMPAPVGVMRDTMFR